MELVFDGGVVCFFTYILNKEIPNLARDRDHIRAPLINQKTEGIALQNGKACLVVD